MSEIINKPVMLWIFMDIDDQLFEMKVIFNTDSSKILLKQAPCPLVFNIYIF
jgi:hypothetical protein